MEGNRPTCRLQVTIPADLMKNIDALCKVSGMSRSAWVECTLGSAVMSYKDLIAGASAALVQEAANNQKG